MTDFFHTQYINAPLTHPALVRGHGGTGAITQQLSVRHSGHGAGHGWGVRQNRKRARKRTWSWTEKVNNRYNAAHHSIRGPDQRFRFEDRRLARSCWRTSRGSKSSGGYENWEFQFIQWTCLDTPAIVLSPLQCSYQRRRYQHQCYCMIWQSWECWADRKLNGKRGHVKMGRLKNSIVTTHPQNQKKIFKRFARRW